MPSLFKRGLAFATGLGSYKRRRTRSGTFKRRKSGAKGRKLKRKSVRGLKKTAMGRVGLQVSLYITRRLGPERDSSVWACSFACSA